MRAERYFKIDATEEDTRVVVSLTLGPDEGRRVLASADTDQDGIVSAAESDAYLASFADGLASELPMTLDGASFPAVWDDVWMDPIGQVGRRPVSVEMVAHLALDGREHELYVEDGMRRDPYERTDVAFRGRDGADLLSCRVGEQSAPDTCSRGASYGPGVGAPAGFGARIAYPTRSENQLFVAALVSGVMTLVAALLAALAWRRRKRKART